MKLSFYVLPVLCLILAGCNGEQNGNNGTDDEYMYDPAHNARNSLDYYGTYTGVLPCADCEGIETTVILHYDDTYTRLTKYLGKNDETIHDNSGPFRWNEAGNTVTLKNLDPPNQYFVGENMLIHLDKDGERITGDLADQYVLQKRMDQSLDARMEDLTGYEWELFEIDGESVAAQGPQEKRPFIQFSESERQATGYGGCNSFFAAFELDEGNRISFSGIGATKMACPDMSVERAFFNALENAASFEYTVDEIILKDSRENPLARLASVVD